MHSPTAPTDGGTPSSNRLQFESSPYLQQHARNPVDWYPWGDEALSRARQENKPIFLSIGYSACHWCHVMERESFEDPAIAALMNEHFVNIKVDREERPDIDQIYMAAVQLITRRGGWPMSVFLTPDGSPFYGGTYWPPTARMGMRGFREILLLMHDFWVNRRAEVEESSRNLVDAIGKYTSPTFEISELGDSLLKNAEREILGSLDRVHGGFGGAPKFPHPMDLRVLLRTWKRFGNQSALDAVTLTLEKMAGGGIYDHLGGGFHRYSTDAHWLVPHFEKMLYDNALLIPVYLEAYQATGREDFARIARESLDYVLREMTAVEGGFYSTQDADSEGVEGKFFVWTPEEIKHILGDEDGQLFCACYDVSPGGNWEGHSILNRPKPLNQLAKELRVPIEQLAAQLDWGRRKLLEHRNTRIAPGTDKKILAAWNGLMMSAMARGSQILRDPKYLHAAQRAARFVLDRMRASIDTAIPAPAVPRRLVHCWMDGAAKFNAYLDDYACLMDGLIELFQTDFNPQWLTEAQALAEQIQQHFADPNDQIFFYTSDDHETLISRTKEVQDNATPAAHSCAVTAIMRLSKVTGRENESSGWKSLEAVSGLMADHPRGAAQALIALDYALGPTPEIVLVEGDQPEKADQLLATFHRQFVPSYALVRVMDPESVPAILEATVEGKPASHELTLYLCHRGVCDSPSIGFEAANLAIRLL